MDFVKDLRAKAKAANKTIVLCEGEDKRVVEAASVVVKEGIAKIILLGNEEKIKSFGFDMTGVNIVDPATDPEIDKYAELLFEARKGKLNKKTGAPEYADAAAAKEFLLRFANNTGKVEGKDKLDNTMYGALMLKAGVADGFVSGACHSTANTLRPGLQVIKTAPGVSTVSSCFIMVAPEGGNKYLPDGIAIFGDCAININPDENQLADIAVASADTAKRIGGIEPRVAMLSFSTKGSGADPKDGNTVEKVLHATNIAHEKAPSLALDGEFQFDAAIAPEVGELKAPGSAVAGHANTFIFPNINAGNIGYKIAARMGGWKAIGPVCQGFAKPLNDLSRGCNVEEIVDTVAVTALQA